MLVVGNRDVMQDTTRSSDNLQTEVGVRNLKLDAKRMRGKRRERAGVTAINLNLTLKRIT